MPNDEGNTDDKNEAAAEEEEDDDGNCWIGAVVEEQNRAKSVVKAVVMIQEVLSGLRVAFSMACFLRGK